MTDQRNRDQDRQGGAAGDAEAARRGGEHSAAAQDRDRQGQFAGRPAREGEGGGAGGQTGGRKGDQDQPAQRDQQEQQDPTAGPPGRGGAGMSADDIDTIP